jgi:hypothetical protein
MTDASSLQCERSGLPFEEGIFQARSRRQRGRKIKAIDHRQAKTARRHGMQRIGINPNVEKVEMTGETNAHRAFLGEDRDR